MASYASTTRASFSKFIPAVDSEVYGKLLAKQDTEYIQGVQKVNSIIDSVASLPVVSEPQRQYIQGLVNGITSKVNRMVGAEWSDQKIQGTIASQAATLYSDPKVQKAVADASIAKKLYSDIDEDEARTKGANSLNKQAALDAFNAWKQGNTLDTPLSVQYVNYRDVLGDFEKYYKDKNPNTRITVKTAGYYKDPVTGKEGYNTQLAAQQWDAVTSKWKELLPGDVERDFQNFVKVNPMYQQQLDINSAYTYKNFNALDAVKTNAAINQRKIEVYSKGLNNIEVKLNLMDPDDPDRKTYELEKERLSVELNNTKSLISEESLKNQLYAIASNPAILEQYRKDMYLTDLTNTVVGKHAYIQQESINHEGMSPSQKNFKQKELDLQYKNLEVQYQRLDIANKELAIKERWIELKEGAAKAKQLAMTSGAADEGVNAHNTLDPWDAFSAQKANTDATILNKIYRYQFNDPTLASRFKLDENNQPIPKSEQDAKFLQNLYTQKQQAYKNGGHTDDGTQVNLSKTDRMFLSEIENKNRVSEAIGSKIKEAETALEESLKNNPNWQSVQKGLNEIQNLRYQYQGKTYNKQDVLRAITAQHKYMEYHQKYNENSDYPVEFPEKQQELAQEAGFKNYAEMQAVLKVGEKHGVNYSTISKIDGERKQFLNNYVKANDYLVNNQAIPWRTIGQNGKPTQIPKSQVIPLLHGIESPILTKEKYENVNVSYVQDVATGEYRIKISDTKGTNPEYYKISENEAKSHGFTNMQTQDIASQLLRINKNQIGGTSNTFSPPTYKDKNGKEISNPDYHTFNDALYLKTDMMNDKPVEVRYHVKFNEGIYSVEFWIKDPKNPNDKGRLYRDKSGQILEPTSTSLSDIREAINNFAGNNTTRPSVQYYDFGETSDPIVNNTNNNAE